MNFCIALGPTPTPTEDLTFTFGALGHAYATKMTPAEYETVNAVVKRAIAAPLDWSRAVGWQPDPERAKALAALSPMERVLIASADLERAVREVTQGAG